MSWNPTQYLKFSNHRLRPALELLDRIPTESPSTVVDLGCGAGNVTRFLAERWPDARVTGLDSSSDMIEKARAESDAIDWVVDDIAAWSPETPPDVVYSNAALQWLDGHTTLLPRLFQTLAPGGCLAVQMPLSWGMPSHRLMRETLANGNRGEPIGPEDLPGKVARKWVEDADVYYDLLSPLAESIDIWETEYLQILEGEDPVLEWVRGTGLRPILDGLTEPDLSTFLDTYRARLREAYPQRPDDKTLYPFRRLFIVATR